MPRFRPKWALTNTDWETRKIIWQRLALGEPISKIQLFFELNADKYCNAPLDRDTITRVTEELSNLPSELITKLITEVPEIKSYILEIRPDLKPESVSPLSKVEDMPLDAEPGSSASGALQPNSGERQINRVIEHDKNIYYQADKIISDEGFRKLSTFLYNTCFSKSQMCRIERYRIFFNQEANKFIDMNLRHACYKFCIGLEKLFDFMEQYSCEYIWWENLIKEGKVNPPTNWHQFFDIVKKEDDTFGLYDYEREEFYILMENAETFDYFEVLHPESTWPYQIPTSSDWKRSLDYLISDCKAYYNEYRSHVRDLLNI
jgi:hypothetical protein